ncbi:MAG TPA: CPBP family glutamic-type intramembrane protease [Gammaproteobacteria bacterium]
MEQPPLTPPLPRLRMQPLLLSALLTLAMLITAWQRNSATLLAVAVPTSLLAYLLYFSIGGEALAQRLRNWCGAGTVRCLAVPLGLVALLYLYVALTGGAPLAGNSWQIPLLFCAPVIFYLFATRGESVITWKDAVGGLLCILPYALRDYPFSSDLPLGGGGIDNLYLTLAIIASVYALVVVRRLPAVGFEPLFSWSALGIALKWWAIFFVIVLAVGLPGGLIRWEGYEPLTPALLIAGLGLFLRTLFGTALPEELVFRGLIMNLLRQRIGQTGNWRRYLYGSLLLLPLAALAGYTIEDKAQWFPLLCAALLLGWTLWLIRKEPAQAADHTAQLLISTLFGLAHYHVHSTLFIGLAMLAGWAYAQVYRKTGSVFISALTHTLVNTTPPLFGLMLVR